MNMVGTAACYYTWDSEKGHDGLYHVGEGGHWGWHIGKGFKTLAGARRWAIRMAGTDTYTE